MFRFFQIVLLSLFFAQAGAACTVPSEHQSMQESFAIWVNALRAENGLGPLKHSPHLAQAALNHSCDMARHNVMSHASSDGGDLRERLGYVGYKSRRAAENVAMSSQPPSAATAAKLWQASPGHLRNLLDPSVIEMGFAAAIAKNGHSFFTFVAARPR